MRDSEGDACHFAYGSRRSQVPNTHLGAPIDRSRQRADPRSSQPDASRGSPRAVVLRVREVPKFSLITKLLAKAENVAATVFDKLRFRIIVPQRADIIPTISYLCQNVLPYNYAIPRQSHNTLVDKEMLQAVLQKVPDAVPDEPVSAIKQPSNHHSGTTYKTVNFIVDFPVRVPERRLEVLRWPSATPCSCW